MKHLKNAPVKEAIIEIQVQPFVDLTKENVGRLSLGNSYQVSEFMRQTQFKFSVSPDNILEVSTEDAPIQGGIFKDDDRGFICQIMRERLTVSKIRPYTNFSELESEMIKLWEIYVAAFQPSKIARVAIRFINEIGLQKDLKFYLRNNKIDKQIAGLETTHSYHRYDVMKTEREHALIQLVVDRRERENKKLIIDIEVYSLIQTNSDDPIIWTNVMKKLHDLKNEIFFDIITEKYAKECM